MTTQNQPDRPVSHLLSDGPDHECEGQAHWQTHVQLGVWTELGIPELALAWGHEVGCAGMNTRLDTHLSQERGEQLE